MTECTHPLKNRYVAVRWQGAGRVRVTTCEAEGCGRVDEVVECDAGVHSLFDICPGRDVCQGSD